MVTRYHDGLDLGPAKSVSQDGTFYVSGFQPRQPGASRRDQALFLRCLCFYHKTELSNEFIKVQMLSPVPEFVDRYGVDLSKLTNWLPSNLGISCFDKHNWKTSCVRVSSDRTCHLCLSPSVSVSGLSEGGSPALGCKSCDGLSVSQLPPPTPQQAQDDFLDWCPQYPASSYISGS